MNVQGESPKTHAALLTEASQLPDHQGGEEMAIARHFVAAAICGVFVISTAHTQTKTYDPFQDVCRTGIGASSPTECEKARHELTQAIQTQARASPDLLEFERIMIPIYKATRFAFTAVILCRLRSETYLRAFTTNQLMIGSREAERLRLSPAELQAASFEMQRVVAQEHLDLGHTNDAIAACRRLVNSAEMDRLDDFHRRITGGYH